MKARRNLRLLNMVLCAALLGGIGVTGGRAAHFLVPANPLLEPEPNDHNVPLTASVSITYDEDILSDTVSALTFAVFGMESGLLSGAYIVDGGVIQLNPDHPFHAGELVQVSATTGTLNYDDIGPLQPTVWQFRARATGGSAFFKDTGQELGEMNSRGVVLGDLDGDADLDAFVAACGPSFVWINTGGGNFVDSGQLLGSNLCSVDAALGDLDKDGDLDLFTVSFGSSEFGKVWFNNGEAVFALDTDQNLGNAYGEGVALGDLDGDADLDAFYVRNGAPIVLFNDGTGSFHPGTQDLGDQSSMDVALGDLDGNGTLDAYVANINSEDRVYLNDGSGYFNESGQDLSASSNNSAALGDLDGDGDLDVYLATTVSLSNPAGSEIWFNDGSGLFSKGGQTIGNSSTNQAYLTDLDGDGDLDVFTANLMSICQVWQNDGTGFFSLTRQFFSQFNKPYLELGDLDNDGDLDAFLTEDAKPGSVWLNQDHVFWNFGPLIHK
jgi:hypothetical protein